MNSIYNVSVEYYISFTGFSSSKTTVAVVILVPAIFTLSPVLNGDQVSSEVRTTRTS